MTRYLRCYLFSIGKEVKKEDNGGGGDRKKVIGENEMLMLLVGPRFFSGSIISRLNLMPEKGKEVEG